LRINEFSEPLRCADGNIRKGKGTLINSSGYEEGDFGPGK